MTESKKKNSWFFLLIATCAFLALVFFLLFSFISAGRNQAIEAAQDKLLAYAAVWGVQMSEEINHSDDYGGIIEGMIKKEGVKPLDNKILSFANSVVEHTDYYRIYIVNDKFEAMDDLGRPHDMSFYSLILSGEESKIPTYVFLNSDDSGNSKVVLCTYPLGKNNGFVMFFYDPESVEKKYIDSAYKETAFAVMFKKDGTVLHTLDFFKDSDSRFVTGTNILNAIQEGTSKEKYNIFKSKLYNVTGCAIQSTYKGDERTIITVPLGIEDWYMGFGIRQYMVDNLIELEFNEVKSATIKLAIVLVSFATCMIGWVIVNASRAKEKGRVLEDKADKDLLTDLTNKAATERFISEYMEENPQSRGVLFILDIDNFKKVNDTMGHAFGDTLLKTLGKELRTEFRVTDIVGRTGGDEFMIFLKDVNDDLIVEREANRVTHFFHDFKAGGDYVKYSATASIGAAIFPEDGTNFKDLYVSADQALYKAKKRGKNQLVFYNEAKYGKSQ